MVLCIVLYVMMYVMQVVSVPTERTALRKRTAVKKGTALRRRTSFRETKALQGRTAVREGAFLREREVLHKSSVTSSVCFVKHMMVVLVVDIRKGRCVCQEGAERWDDIADLTDTIVTATMEDVILGDSHRQHILGVGHLIMCDCV